MADVVSLQFEKSKQRTSLVKSFRFRLKQNLIFKPGQFAKILFDTNNFNNRELNKYLSFSSSPQENYIEFTKKISDSVFSQKLDSLTKGDRVSVQAPLGNCVFKDEYKRIAFLVGGIGITPVASIASYIIQKKLDTYVDVFYSNRNSDEIAFKEELNCWQKINSKMRVIYTLTDSGPQKPDFLQGRINKDILIQELKEIKNTIFFIFGPPRMVSAMNQLCIDIGCTREKIKKEQFIGY